MIFTEITPPRGALLAFAFAPLITFNTLAQSGIYVFVRIYCLF